VSEDIDPHDDLDDLFARPPSERLIVHYENPGYPVVFIARWPRNLFTSPGEFNFLTERYDCALQGFIQDMPQEELAGWHVPHEECKDLSIVEVTPERSEDAVDWMERNFPFANIPWLRRGEHTEIIRESEGTFGELMIYGDGGYLYVFVADLLPRAS
jgi:hypothetical protein